MSDVDMVTVECGGCAPPGVVPSILRVRNASVGDLPWLVEQMREFSRSYGSKHDLYPGDDIAATGMLSLFDGHVVLIAERGDERLGCMGGMLVPHFMNPALSTLTEVFWWVPVAHRGTSAALRLLRSFLDIGHERADWTVVTTEAISPLSPEAMQKRGGRLIEQSYLWER